MARNKKSKPSVMLVCNQCGTTVKKYVSQLHGDIAYCSRACYFAAKKEGKSLPEQNGGRNPCWEGGRSSVVFTCEICGKEKRDWAGSNRRFCSNECSTEYKARNRVVLNCEQCGKEFTRSLASVSMGWGRYCSRSCASRAIAKKHFCGPKSYEHRKKIGDSCRGEKNYAWKGGVKSENERIRNSMDYAEWRKSVFEFDNFTCVRCGRRGGYLYAHHIDGFAAHPEFRLDQDNGITLCDDCHKLIHSKDFRADAQSSASLCVVRGEHACVL